MVGAISDVNHCTDISDEEYWVYKVQVDDDILEDDDMVLYEVLVDLECRDGYIGDRKEYTCLWLVYILRVCLLLCRLCW